MHPTQKCLRNQKSDKQDRERLENNDTKTKRNDCWSLVSPGGRVPEFVSLPLSASCSVTSPCGSSFPTLSQSEILGRENFTPTIDTERVVQHPISNADRFETSQDTRCLPVIGGARRGRSKKTRLRSGVDSLAHRNWACLKCLALPPVAPEAWLLCAGRRGFSGLRSLSNPK